MSRDKIDVDDLFAGLNDQTCACGKFIYLGMPHVCACGQIHKYWTQMNGRAIKLKDMTVGHLMATIRFLGEKYEAYKLDQIMSKKIEVALDIFSEELGSRDKELSQLSGISAALFRALK